MATLEHTSTETTEVMTIEEVAPILRVHPETVRRRLVEKKIYGFQVGTAWRIPAEEVERLMTGRPSLLSEEVMEEYLTLKAIASF